VARDFLCEVVKQAQAKGLTSDEHFTVDGTLIECGRYLSRACPRYDAGPSRAKSRLRG
jgi:hypothetical protein